MATFYCRLFLRNCAKPRPRSSERFIASNEVKRLRGVKLISRASLTTHRRGPICKAAQGHNSRIFLRHNSTATKLVAQRRSLDLEKVKVLSGLTNRTAAWLMTSRWRESDDSKFQSFDVECHDLTLELVRQRFWIAFSLSTSGRLIQNSKTRLRRLSRSVSRHGWWPTASVKTNLPHSHCFDLLAGVLVKKQSKLRHRVGRGRPNRRLFQTTPKWAIAWEVPSTGNVNCLTFAQASKITPLSAEQPFNRIGKSVNGL